MKESEALIQTFLRVLSGGKPPVEVEVKDDAEPGDVVKDSEGTVQGDADVEMTMDQDADLNANKQDLDQG